MTVDKIYIPVLIYIVLNGCQTVPEYYAIPDTQKLQISGKVKFMKEKTCPIIFYYENEYCIYPPQVQILYHFNKYGYIKYIENFNENNQLIGKKIYIYQKKQRLIKVKEFDENQTILSQKRYHYDLRGNLSRIYQNNSKSMDSEYSFQTMKKSNRTNFVLSKECDTLNHYKKQVKMDETYKINEENFYRDSIFHLNKKLLYDSTNNLCTDEVIKRNGRLLYHYKYFYKDFDDNKNWTVQYYANEFGVPELKTTREFEYYK